MMTKEEYAAEREEDIRLGFAQAVMAGLFSWKPGKGERDLDIARIIDTAFSIADSAMLRVHKEREWASK